MPSLLPQAQTIDASPLRLAGCVFIAITTISAGTYHLGTTTLASNLMGAHRMTEERFTGHSLRLDAAVNDAAKIFVARVRHVGSPDAGAPGEAYFDGTILDVIRWLRSDAKDDLQKSQIVVAYTVQTLPPESAEHAPEVGHSYLFLLKARADGSLRAIKILPAHEKYIHLVEDMIRKKKP